MTTTMTTSRRVAMIVSSPLRSKRLNGMTGLLSSFDERLFLPSLKPVSSPRQNRASNIDGTTKVGQWNIPHYDAGVRRVLLFELLPTVDSSEDVFCVARCNYF